MKKLGLIVVALALTLAGCNSDEKKASELFQRRKFRLPQRIIAWQNCK